MATDLISFKPEDLTKLLVRHGALNAINAPLPTGMNVAVVTSSDGSLDLTQAVRSVKAALLYADHVRLYNIEAFILLSTKRSLDRGDAAKYELMIDLLTQFGYSDQADSLRSVAPTIVAIKKHRGPLPPQMIAVKAKFARLIKILKRGLVTGVDGFGNSALPELELAISSGKVSIHQFGADGSSEVLLREYLRAIGDAAAASKMFPMFDPGSADMLRVGTELGMVDAPEGGKPARRHAALAIELMQRLPVINADVSTILDVRKDLRRHLDKFREAMVSYTASVESEAWAVDFAQDAEIVYIEKVGPAVQEIEEAVRSSKPLMKIVNSLANPLPTLTGSAIGVGLSQYGHLTSTTAGLVGGTAVLAARTINDIIGDSQKIMTNKLYFYYRAKIHQSGS